MEDDRSFLAILWLTSLIVTVLVPIIIVYFLKKEKGETWERHFKYMINFFLVEIIIGTTAFLLAITIIGAIIAIPLWFVLVIYHIVIPILAAINLFNGKEDVPFILNIIK